MSYSAPTTRATGDLITASIWNTDMVNNIIYLDTIGAQPGDLKWTAVSATASGWLNCDGSTYTGGAATYAALAAAVPSLVSGSNLIVPDFRGRAPVGPDPTGAHLTGETPALLATGGADTHALTLAELASHNHGGNTGTDAPAHTHLMGSASGGSNTAAAIGASEGTANVASGTPSTTHTHSIASAGSGTAHTNVQPFLAANVWIKT